MLYYEYTRLLAQLLLLVLLLRIAGMSGFYIFQSAAEPQFQ